MKERRGEMIDRLAIKVKASFCDFSPTYFSPLFFALFKFFMRICV
jgi:hypothetical protein